MSILQGCLLLGLSPSSHNLYLVTHTIHAIGQYEPAGEQAGRTRAEALSYSLAIQSL